MLDQLNELSGQAATSPDKRAKPGVIKAILTGLTSGIGIVSGLAKVWSLTGDVICAHFGIPNPLKVAP